MQIRNVQKSGKEKFKESKFHTARKIQHAYNTHKTRLYKTRTTQKIKHKVGVLVSGLEALCRSPR